MARAMMFALWERHRGIQGYELIQMCIDNQAEYPLAKRTLQQLRADGVIVVSKMGPPGKQKWIAYQHVELSKSGYAWMDAEAAAGDADITAARQLGERMKGKRAVVGVGWLDRRDKRAALIAAINMGLVRLEVVGQ